MPFEVFGGGTGTPSTLFRTIACRELWGGWRDVREIRDGALHATGADLCQDQPKLVHAYDSADWDVGVPVTYFQGPYDVTTTVAQAQYHFDHHAQVPRQLVSVPEASHAPLTLGLAGRGCADAVWHKLEDAPDDLGTALSTCTQAPAPPIGLTTAPAGP